MKRVRNKVERCRDLFRCTKMEGGFALGLEVEGTLCVREPVVLDVVCKPLHKAWGSLKHSPRHNIQERPRATLSPRHIMPEVTAHYQWDGLDAW